MKARIGRINRKTRETEVSVSVNLDGKGKIDVKTGISFLDHMIISIAKHSMIDLKLKQFQKTG